MPSECIEELQLKNREAKKKTAKGYIHLQDLWPFVHVTGLRNCILYAYILVKCHV